MIRICAKSKPKKITPAVMLNVVAEATSKAKREMWSVVKDMKRYGLLTRTSPSKQDLIWDDKSYQYSIDFLQPKAAGKFSTQEIREFLIQHGYKMYGHLGESKKKYGGGGRGKKYSKLKGAGLEIEISYPGVERKYVRMMLTYRPVAKEFIAGWRRLKTSLGNDKDAFMKVLTKL